MSDPYPLPFAWSDEFRASIPELIGLIPHDCEQGFYPLIDGSEIECPTCANR
jgi:hypothetical protein